MFIETSAKAGYNVKALFRQVAAALPGIDPIIQKQSSACPSFPYSRMHSHQILCSDCVSGEAGERTRNIYTDGWCMQLLRAGGRTREKAQNVERS